MANSEPQQAMTSTQRIAHRLREAEEHVGAAALLLQQIQEDVGAWPPHSRIEVLGQQLDVFGLALHGLKCVAQNMVDQKKQSEEARDHGE